MSRIATIVLALAILALPAAAQVGLPVSDDSRAGAFPYVGVIKNDRVTIRTAPLAGGNNAVTRLNVGAEVKVLGKSTEWLKIKPPEGCFSTILKVAVLKDADGMGGTVRESTHGWPVWAGSNVNPTVSEWPVQVKLTKGHRVQIVGEMRDAGDDFYKIAPPEGMVMYVLSQYVARKDGSAPVDPTVASGDLPPGAMGGGNVTKAGGDTVVTPPVTKPVVEAPKLDPLMQSALKGVREAEAAMKAEFAKPAAGQDLESLKKRYEILKAEHGTRLVGRIDAGLKTVQIAMERRRKIMDLEARFGATPTEESKTPAPILSVKGPFTACGTLSSSQVYEGADAAYRKFAVHDRNDPMRIVAYVQDPGGTLDLSQYVGKYVGINGDVRPQSGSLSVITVRKITELGPGGLPALPGAVVTGELPSAQPPRKVGPAEPAKTPEKLPNLGAEPKTPPVEPGFREEGPAETVVIEPDAPKAPVVKEEPKKEEPKKVEPKAPESRPAPSDQPPTGFKIAPEDPATVPVNPEEYK